LAATSFAAVKPPLWIAAAGDNIIFRKFLKGRKQLLVKVEVTIQHIASLRKE